MNQNILNKPNFDHRQWLKAISQALENARAFGWEVWETCKDLFEKGWKLGIKEIRFFVSRSTLMDFVCGGLNAFLGFLSTLVFLSGIGLVGYQTVLWLIDGVWTAFPLAVAFNFLFENTALHAWVANPESWFGLQQVVSWCLENIPLSLALIVPGFILASALAGIMTGAIMIRYYQFKKIEKN